MVKLRYNRSLPYTGTKISEASIIQQAWKERKSPDIHGWVYSLEDGLIKPICTMTYKDHLDPLYEFDDL